MGGALLVAPLWANLPPDNPPLLNAMLMLFGIVLSFVAALLASVILVGLLSLGSQRDLTNFMRPIQLCFTGLLSLPILPNEVVTYFVRKQSWTFLQRWTLGLDGYRFPLPDVTTVPDRTGGAHFRYEALLPAVESRAIAARLTWIQSHLGTASDLFSKLVLTTPDVSDMLKQIEHDQSLVHASYYSDDACIGRIADWIAEHARAPARIAA